MALAGRVAGYTVAATSRPALSQHRLRAVSVHAHNSRKNVAAAAVAAKEQRIAAVEPRCREKAADTAAEAAVSSSNEGVANSGKRRISGVADPGIVYTGRSTGPLFSSTDDGDLEVAPCSQDLGWQLSDGWRPGPSHLSKEELWEAIRKEAAADAASEPALASFMHSSILAHKSLEKAMAFILANKLESPTLLSTQIMRLILDVYEADPSIMEDCSADIQAVRERDPACDSWTQIILFFKGFQALQSHRVAHHLWGHKRRILATALQSRLSEVFHVDIHPGARLGRGLMMDHATGVVIGETAVVGDNVSMLHEVTLGGSGVGSSIRHPTIGHGALLGAGAVLLGPIIVGAGTKVGAGSVVLQDLPAHSIAVGVPARIVRTGMGKEPCRDMDQTSGLSKKYDFII